jgi:hypothetical protein
MRPGLGGRLEKPLRRSYEEGRLVALALDVDDLSAAVSSRSRLAISPARMSKSATRHDERAARVPEAAERLLCMNVFHSQDAYVQLTSR